MAAGGEIFLNCAGSRTQHAVMRGLRARGAAFRAYGRKLDHDALRKAGATAIVQGGMLDIDAMCAAMQGASTVVHVAPALQDKEVAMGQFAIDAARRAGVGHFVYVSVILPQIDYLMNHRAKLAVEDYLVMSGLPFTIVRPMHYFQNLDIAAAAGSGRLMLTYDVDRPLGFVDMEDVGEVTAKVATEDGHIWATYDLSSPEQLSGTAMAAALSELTGRPIGAERIPLDALVAMLAPMLASEPHATDYTAAMIERLFNFYSRFGLKGNANVLRWLLGREPVGFQAYARRCLGSD